MSIASVLVFDPLSPASKESGSEHEGPLQSMLRAKGYELIKCNTVQEACQRLDKDPPHIVFINLDDSLEGLQVLKYIRKLNTLSLPVCHLWPDDELIRQARDQGCQAFLYNGKREQLERDFELLMERITVATRRVLMPPILRPRVEVLLDLERASRLVSVAGTNGCLRMGALPEGLRAKERGQAIQALDDQIAACIDAGWSKQDEGLLTRFGVTVVDGLDEASADVLRGYIEPAEPKRRLPTVVFAGALDTLRLPLELMPYTGSPHQEFLALKLPVARRIANYQYTISTLRPQDLYGRERVNALLVGANVRTFVDPVIRQRRHFDKPLSHVAREIDELDRLLDDELPEYVVGAVEALSKDDASVKKLRLALDGGQHWHIIHFAGHIVRYGQPQRQGLLLLSENGCDGSVVTPEEWRQLLEARPPHLVVFSSCEAMRVGGAGVAPEDSLVGATLAAGVPQVLGFRWNLEDEAGGRFMKPFYRALLGERLSASEAVHEARKTLYLESTLTTPAWASAVLISQCPPLSR